MSETQIDPKQAIRLARGYVADMFADDHPTDIGLEEIFLDVDGWSVTIGFSRPWDVVAGLALPGRIRESRSYKQVKIKKSDGSLISIKDRID